MSLVERWQWSFDRPLHARTQVGTTWVLPPAFPGWRSILAEVISGRRKRTDEVAGENLEMTKPRQRTPISAFRGSKHTNIQILTRISAGSRGKDLNVLSGRGFGLARLFARVWFSKSAASAAFCWRRVSTVICCDCGVSIFWLWSLLKM